MLSTLDWQQKAGPEKRLGLLHDHDYSGPSMYDVIEAVMKIIEEIHM
jgi:hypothetical protein